VIGHPMHTVYINLNVHYTGHQQTPQLMNGQMTLHLNKQQRKISETIENT
jgi:hypothetical protein